MISKFYYPTKIISGHKSLENIPSELEMFGASSPLVMRDKSENKSINILRESDLNLSEFVISENDNLETIKDIASIFNNFNKDSIIAVGRAIHFAKLLNLFLFAPKNTDLKKTIDFPIKTKPSIFIPTGSLEESDAVDSLFFNAVVIDRRMLSISNYSISSSLMAFSNSIESLLFYGNPFADVYANSAIAIFKDNLKAKKIFELINAEVISCATVPNLKFSRMEIFGKVFADACGLPKGICMGILLPYVVKHYLEETNLKYKNLSFSLIDLTKSVLPKESFKKIDKAREKKNEISKNIIEISNGRIDEKAINTIFENIFL